METTETSGEPAATGSGSSHPAEASPELTQLLADITVAAAAAKEAIASARDARELEDARVAVLGKKGSLAELSARMGALSATEKPIAGKLLNNHKGCIINAHKEKKDSFERAGLEAALRAEAVDITLPGVRPPAGHLHPVTQVTNEILDIFRSLGFTPYSGPEIENEWFNFESLNIPAHHPARDMQDTFFTERNMVLRTHTSPTQIRAMRTMKPPIAIVTPGKVYRCDSDSTHSPMFHQMEGLLIARHVSMAHLKGVLNAFLRAFFGGDVPTRFRPSFFPFTEPSAEVDIARNWATGNKGAATPNADIAWMEVLGCGLVHPAVLRNAGIDPNEWQGFAFGLGLDRLAMLKYGITDIRTMYKGDMRFLRQF